MKRSRKKTVKVHLEYPGTGYHSRGEVPLPKEPSLRGLQVDIFPDELLDSGQEGAETVETGVPQIQLAGTPSALTQLGTFLIAVAENRSPVGFLSHFDLHDSSGNRSAQLVVRHKKEPAASTVRVT